MLSTRAFGQPLALQVPLKDIAPAVELAEAPFADIVKIPTLAVCPFVKPVNAKNGALA
jgi:hypothetical protein